jgi:hypothetical protein
MVAGRRLGGGDQQGAAKDQPRCRCQLGIEAVLENSCGSRETRGLRTDVEPGRQIDQQDDREAEDAEDGDDAPQLAATGAHRRNRKDSGEQGDRDQHVEVRLPGGPGSNRRWRCGGQPGVTGLPHLDRAVINELRGDQAGRGGDDHGADRTVGRDRCADANRCAPCSRRRGACASLRKRQAAEEHYAEWAQAPAKPSTPAAYPCADAPRRAARLPIGAHRPPRDSRSQGPAAARHLRPGGPHSAADLRPGANESSIDRSVD